MSNQEDYSSFRPMTSEEMDYSLRLAVLLELKVLRSVLWKKGMTLEQVVRGHGVDWFAKRVSDHLRLANSMLFKGPPNERHTAGGRPSPGQDDV